MKQSLALLALVLAALHLGRIGLGQSAALVIGYGAMAVMALMMAATFLWLWRERTTPLALGMAWSWLGAGLFAGWWWGLNLAGAAPPPSHAQPVFVLLAIGLVGALLHFAVIHRSFGLHGAGFLWPVVLSLGLSGAVYALV
jgi:hypothetical protein